MGIVFGDQGGKMKKGLIVYDSLTGNTKKVAEAIASGGDWEIVKVAHAPRQLQEYRIVVIGSPNMHAKPSQAVQLFMEEAMLPAACAFFVTFGAPVWGQISS